jgi:hypothetical protein
MRLAIEQTADNLLDRPTKPTDLKLECVTVANRKTKLISLFKKADISKKVPSGFSATLNTSNNRPFEQAIRNGMLTPVDHGYKGVSEILRLCVPILLAIRTRRYCNRPFR